LVGQEHCRDQQQQDKAAIASRVGTWPFAGDDEAAGRR
jgi:hypothetical protein